MMATIQRVGIVGACFLAFPGAVWAAAQEVPVPGSLQRSVNRVEVSIEPQTARRGQTITWKVQLQLAEGFHTYPLDPKLSSSPVQLRFLDRAKLKAGDAAVIPVGQTKDVGVPRVVTDAGVTQTEYEGVVVYEQSLVVSPQATPGQSTLRVKFSPGSQVCDAQGCKPLVVLKLDTPLTILADSVPVEARYQEAVSKWLGASTPVKPPSPPNGTSAEQPTPPSASGPAASGGLDDARDYPAEMDAIREQLVGQDKASVTLVMFLLTGVFWGAVSLVTPCVFPMIPITVSFFLKQSEKEHHRPLTMAAVYCATIVGVLTIAAVLLLSFFQQLSRNPLMNFGLGALFIFFALSLFGMYEIELPSGLARFTSAREGRGGLVGTMFMALTFTIVSFACVAPFLGGFGGTAATAGFSWVELALGALAFSLTFASPFFVLALFPTLLKKMPRSGSWLNSVKVVMGFLEFAAALKFLRMGEIVLSSRPPTFFTYDLVLGLYVALSVLCGLYLLGLFRLPHDSPAEHVGVMRMVFSMLFLGLALYLAPGLFRAGAEGEKQKPAGTVFAWVDSFLLPEPHEAKVGDLAWTADLKQALADSRKQLASGRKRPVLLNFTGES